MSYCSRSCRRRFAVLDFKSWEFSCICGHCQQHFCLRMRRNSYFWTSCKSFGDLVTFSVDFFFHFICWMSFDSPTPISLQSAKFQRLRNVFHWLLHFISWKFAVFLLPVYFIYCAKPEVDMAIHWRVIAFLLPICCVNLVTLTSSHIWRVTWSTLPKS